MTTPVTALYAALGAFLLLGLVARVVWCRRTARIGLGTGGDPVLSVAVRAHGNAVETLPIALLLLLLLELNGASQWLLHGFGILVIGSRLAHAEGLLRHGGGASHGRFYGTLGSWATLAAMALTLFALTLV